MAGVRPTLTVSIALDVASAMIDVSSYLESDEDFTASTGSQTSFEDPGPGAFAFTLDNKDGRFTPDNPSSPYFYTLREGMKATWVLNGRSRTGTIQALEPSFRDDNSSWAQMVVTCDDSLGFLARTESVSLIDEAMSYGGRAQWLMAEPSGSISSPERVGVFPGAPSFVVSGAAGAATWGSDLTFSNGFTTGVQLNDSTDSDAPRGFLQLERTFPEAQTALSNIYIQFGVVITRSSTSRPRIIEIDLRANGFPTTVALLLGNKATATYDRITNTNMYASSQDLSAAGTTGIMRPGIPYLVEINLAPDLFLGGRLVVSVTINGVAVGGSISIAALSNGLQSLQAIRLGQDSLGAVFSRVTYIGTTPSGIQLTGRNMLLGVATSTSAVATAISTLSGVPVTTTAPRDITVGPFDTVNKSYLELLNTLATNSTGEIAVDGSGATLRTGTLVRPTTPKFSLDVETELIGTPEFVRDLTHRVSVVNAKSGTTEIDVKDQISTSSTGTGSDGLDIPAPNDGWLRNVAEDRIRRGLVTSTRVASIKIDARLTPTDRWTDLAGAVIGDKIRLTNLPLTQQGLTVWDGWITGIDEVHNTESDEFTIYLTPAYYGPLFDTANIPYGGTSVGFDVARFMGGTTLKLTAAITTGSASLSVSTTSAAISTTAVPFNIVVDREIMTVTAVSAGPPQTLTVTRAVLGTQAFAHAINSVVEISPATVFDL